MIIAIGTKSQRKISVIEKVLKEFVPQEFQIETFAADSGVGSTPWDQETKDGALNRALNTQKHIQADYYLGLESGLVERYGEVFEEAWACVISDDKKYFGYSSGLKVPQYIMSRMQHDKKEHWQVMDDLNQEKGVDDDGDTWGSYSQNMIIRDISLSEAVRNALVQIFAPQESYYHK
jgi:non-canonical (house-cleaning) NTP pyrophosphatase